VEPAAGQPVQNRGSEAIKRDKHEAIQVAEGYPLWGLAPQHVQLVSKDKDFSLQRSPRPEQSDHDTPDQPAEIAHGDRLLPIRREPAAALGLR
jgi:hypothetical protein